MVEINSEGRGLKQSLLFSLKIVLNTGLSRCDKG